MKKLTVNAMSASYDILIQKGLLNNCAEYITPLLRGKRVMIVTDSNVEKLYLDKVKKAFENTDVYIYSHTFEAGEEHKNLDTVSDIYEALSLNGFDRKDMLVALGGGVCGDITGFAAATYMRGIDFVQIPTTLLSQVDSSVGGKTGVDTKFGKNLVGAFYQPKLVLVDKNTLDTLPEHFFADGMGEVIKYGCIKDSELFDFLCSCDIKENIEDIILRCLEIKRDVVNEDEKENGIRMILNFGHTFGHSIEKLSDFSSSHGECVAKGMVLVTKASERIGLTKSKTADKIEALAKKCGLDCQIEFKLDDIAENAKNDKKGSGDSINIILIEDIGKYIIYPINKNDLYDFLNK